MPQTITLNKDSLEIQHLCKKDKRLAKVISMVGPICYETHSEHPYSFLVHEIIEQMLSIKAGAKIYSRLEELCNGNITPDNVNNLSNEQLKSIGTSNAKVTYIKGLTDAILSGKLDLSTLEYMDDVTVTKELTRLKGIGNWTAKMYLIFVLDRQDILPFEDAAFLQGYAWAYKTTDFSPSSIKTKCRKWKPYSSIAARYMYRALDAGLTREEFHLFK